MSIAENIAAVRRAIDEAARETGRTGGDITLVGASKMNDAATCQEAIRAGIDALGENRVQEMTAKLAENGYDGAPLHFIGHLQRNKVKQVVGKAALIQSVGSLELLEEIDGVELFRDRDFAHQTGVLSFRVDGWDCEELGERLAAQGAAVRAGLHCAPLAHRTAGTLETGTIRLSMSVFNTPCEVERFAAILRRAIR